MPIGGRASRDRQTACPPPRSGGKLTNVFAFNAFPKSNNEHTNYNIMQVQPFPAEVSSEVNPPRDRFERKCGRKFVSRRYAAADRPSACPYRRRRRLATNSKSEN